MASKVHADRRYDRYLSFALGAEHYGLEILRVQEIIGCVSITEVPRTPPCVRGVINLRGKIIPVVDLGILFELGPREEKGRNCIIVVQLSGESDSGRVGLLVDEVSEVIDVSPEDIEKPRLLAENDDCGFIQGMAKSDEWVLTLLDLDRLLSAAQHSSIVDAVWDDASGNNDDATEFLPANSPSLESAHE